MDATITFTINGQKRTVTTDPDRPLLEVLREDLKLTGTKFGCGEGECGACTVLLDDKRTFSCRTAVSKAEGKSVQTIEGLATGDTLHPVQEAFLAEGAFQCGYCTPGMIMATVALLKEKPKPSEEEIRSWMTKNVCRCCSYPRISDAVRRAAGLEAKCRRVW
jgi:aerobic-type carbon monoxide dehydrogenase small subunit (CoxS/CutS family)